MMKPLFTCACLVCSLTLFGQIPQTLSYQGLLTDATGNPVANAAYTVTFNFHTDPTATSGTPQSRTVTGVQTFQGLFTTIIGNGTANGTNAPLNNLVPSLGSTQYYIGVQVNGGTELVPRVPLTAVPYAFMAGGLDPATTLPGSQVGTGVNASNVTTGTLSGTLVGSGVNASNITTGTLSNALLDSDLQDLADGSLTGSLVGSGINASNVTTGTLSGLLVGPGVDGNSITTGTISNLRLDVNLQDLTDGSLSGNKVGTGINASNVTTGVLTLTGTTAATVPVGTTAQRPSAGAGAIRFNTTENVMEYYNGTEWMFLTPKVAYLKDIRLANTDGGTFSANAWRTRVLTVLEGDASVVSLTPNRFRLEPGTYLIEASAPAYRVLLHKCKIINLDTNEELIGTSELTEDISNATGNRSFVSGRVVVTASNDFELQHWSSGTTTSNGFGQATTSSGETEVYSVVKITKLR